VDWNGDETGRLADHSTNLDLVPHFDDGRRRSAERLPERNDDAVGQRRLDDLISVRELFRVRRVDAAGKRLESQVATPDSIAALVPRRDTTRDRWISNC
jgi:hypothetical protein